MKQIKGKKVFLGGLFVTFLVHLSAWGETGNVLMF